MLLLLLSPKFPLREAFEFSQGTIVTPRGNAEDKGEKYTYRVVYAGDFSPCDKYIDIEKLPIISLPKPIKEERVLGKEDYLICAKGSLKGISMYHTLKEKQESDIPLVASNNLIVARPKPEALAINGILYLHNLLDLIIQHLKEEGVREASSSSQSLITIGALNELMINHLDSKRVVEYQERFNSVSTRWEKAYSDLKAIDGELKELNIEISKRIFELIPADLSQISGKR